MGTTRGTGRTSHGFLGAGALGAIASALLGSSLLAVVVDSATSEGNSITSGEVAASPADLRAAVLDDQSCTPSATTDDTTFAAAVDSATISMSAGSQAGSKRICLYNAGGTIGHTTMEFTDVFDGEANTVAGTCDNNEASPQGGNDQTCGANDPGELSELLDGEVQYALACPQECVQPKAGFVFDDVASSPMGLFSIEPGQTLQFNLYFFIDEEATTQQLQAAQTDRLQFDITFAFDDEEPAS